MKNLLTLLTALMAVNVIMSFSYGDSNIGYHKGENYETYTNEATECTDLACVKDFLKSDKWYYSGGSYTFSIDELTERIFEFKFDDGYTGTLEVTFSPKPRRGSTFNPHISKKAQYLFKVIEINSVLAGVRIYGITPDLTTAGYRDDYYPNVHSYVDCIVLTDNGLSLAVVGDDIDQMTFRMNFISHRQMQLDLLSEGN